MEERANQQPYQQTPQQGQNYYQQQTPQQGQNNQQQQIPRQEQNQQQTPQGNQGVQSNQSNGEQNPSNQKRQSRTNSKHYKINKSYNLCVVSFQSIQKYRNLKDFENILEITISFRRFVAGGFFV